MTYTDNYLIYLSFYLNINNFLSAASVFILLTQIIYFLQDVTQTLSKIHVLNDS